MQDTTANKKEDISRFLCENCGANMVYSAAVGGLHCEYCGHKEEVHVTGSVEERSFNEFIRAGAQRLAPMAVDALQIQCSSCGATVNFTPPETATVCAFCGAKIVAQPKAADPLVAPHGVLPFSISTGHAADGFKKWLHSLWFAPSKLKHLAESDKLVSIYIPYWTYDAATVSDYSGQRGDNYTEWETVTVNGKQEQRSVTKTRWTSVSGRVARHFDDVCVPATTSIRREYLERLEPWDLPELRPYEPAYLSGHKAEAYRVPLDGGFERFKEIAQGIIVSDCKRDIGGDRQHINDVNTHYSDISFKHILLPVYSGAYRFSGKTYQIVINGRTGQVHGGRPYSILKIAALVFVLLILILMVVAVLR
ncbi:MAG: primosomal protein N' (replication factor Y) - superfamily II helicase [Acidobacteria bacterium]|nr:primosomal protein N' (replication factor Y) - superfamily II helicase [Acidobacteriota bacterium]